MNKKTNPGVRIWRSDGCRGRVGERERAELVDCAKEVKEFPDIIEISDDLRPERLAERETWFTEKVKKSAKIYTFS